MTREIKPITLKTRSMSVMAIITPTIPHINPVAKERRKSYAGRRAKLMRKVVLLLVLPALLLSGNKKSVNPPSEFSADIQMITPFATERPTRDGKLYMSNGRLRVDLGSMVDVYIVEQKKGWRMFPELKQYFDIGEKQVSTYLPQMTDGSPCPASERPSECRMVGKENVGGRSATKWELVNQHGVHVYLWTDDKLEVAVRWHIENVTYDLTGIHEGPVPDNMFELPPGYAKSDMLNPAR